jgi:hypothetical protein
MDRDSDHPLGGWIDHRAEIHWFEARGIGRREVKIKRFLDALS